MKFKIRFADQIVGFFVVLSLVSLVFVIVMLGRSQRWFKKDLSYKTYLSSAGGLSSNMAVQYRGFTIGSVKEFSLMRNDATGDDEVEVVFIIHEEYTDRVRRGSVMELSGSPLGSSLLFHAGRGAILEEGSTIPRQGSAEARELARQGLVIESSSGDSLGELMANVNSLLAHLDQALGPGTDETEIGQMIGSLNKTLAGVESLPGTLEGLLTKTINDIMAGLKPILSSIDDLLSELNEPDGLLYTVLDTDKDVYQNLVGILASVSDMIKNLDNVIAFIPGQLPQVAGILIDLRETLQTAEDTLKALNNNPLLRGGVPKRLETQSSDTRPRDIRF